VNGGSRIVVLGIVGRLPFAGVAWQALHYLEAFRRLGHDVYYVEDTGEWPLDLDRNEITADPRYTVDYLARVLRWSGFDDRWAYRAASENGRVYGMSEPGLTEVLRDADVLVNLTGATVLREEHLGVPVRIYLETDPVLPQIQAAQGDRFVVEHLAAHTHHATFGENIGAPDCSIPVGRVAYRTTRQPVVLDWWRRSSAESPGDAAHRLLFTTVATWRHTSKDVEWEGRTLRWSKHDRFAPVLPLPGRRPHRFELALAGADAAAIARLTEHGWRVLDAIALTKALLPYRDYVQASDAEFTVAKEQYVQLRSGWFSDRSACYLAAGRPVVTEDTAFGAVLPTGRGLFAFRTLDDAAGAVDAIASDYASHARAAVEIADAYFRAETVVARLLDGVGGS
jgi:hypothetical protein